MDGRGAPGRDQGRVMAMEQTGAACARLPYAFGVTVMPEWFQHEGVEAVLDRIQACGADAIATSPYLLERMPDGQGGREPPPDGEAGKVRPLERSLFGARELWVRTAPAFEHDFARYQGLRYQPSPPTALTRSNADLLDRVMEAAQRRGIQVLLQIMAASPPAYRVQFSGAHAQDQCLGPDGQPHAARVDKNACLASPHVAAYQQALLTELALRYPSVAGFRLDWPEYPPYDLRSALFDFNPAAQLRMQAAGADPEQVRAAARQWLAAAQQQARQAAPGGAAAVVAALTPLWAELLAPQTPLQGLWAAKQASSLGLLQQCRAALDAVPGPRRRLEPQIMPPPLHRISGFPLGQLQGVADAVGVKLYTMHWPMVARYWARDLLGEIEGAAADAVSVAVGTLFGFLDAAPLDPATYRYPMPHEAHPVGVAAQRAKLAAARQGAGAVPVVAFAHSYGPQADVLQRFTLARAHADAVWLNRYGYISDAKFAALGALAPAAAKACS